VLADHLTRKGIAVMRCDDRDFVHPNVKEPLASTIPEFVTDAEAALKVLRARPEIDPKRVGVIGHSEGGITGPRVAAQDKDVAFIVTLAGVGVKGRDALTEQRALIAKSYGATEEELAQGRKISNEIFDAVLNAPDTDSAKAAVIAVLKASPTPPDKPAPTEASFQAAADEFASPYLRDLLAYDPSLYVPKVTVPFLAVNGSKDLQVAPEQNLSGFKTLLANNKDATFIELPGLNHLFQTVTTGAIAEYGDIDETFSPTALDTVSDWIVKRMKP
jgi:pimeloyl-ACP methyl ester carboxylesterase